MKMNSPVMMLVTAIFVLFLLNFWLTAAPASSGGGGGGKWAVYGTTKCGWTNKQLDHMKSNDIDHEFIDCANSANKEKCSGMDGFPTLRHTGTGKEVVGYTTTGL